eukprot:2367928-Rhodomonas_salina.4
MPVLRHRILGEQADCIMPLMLVPGIGHHAHRLIYRTALCQELTSSAHTTAALYQLLPPATASGCVA